MSPLSISDAVHIWQDLEDWDPVGTELINEDDNLYESYKFALFIWTYIIIHPAKVAGKKFRTLYTMPCVIYQKLKRLV